MQSTKPGLLARVFGRGNEKDEENEPWEPPAEGALLSLAKAWHGLHYLLNFSDWEGREPLCYLVTGGTTIGNVDVGYGPARALRSGQVRRFRDALAEIPPEQLEARYDPEQMTDLVIYPAIWDGAEHDDPLGYLKQHYATLVEFLDRAVEEKSGLLIYLS